MPKLSFTFEKIEIMNFSIQPTLENDIVSLVPLEKHDFEELFEVASDPKVWEQHPNKERYQREIFQNFFTGALESTVAFLIAYFREDSIKRVLNNLEVSRVKPYHAELEKILDLKMRTLKDLMEAKK